MGAAAAAASLIGYSLMEFMLGVDAPVSLELLRQIVLITVVDAIISLPLWALGAGLARERAARRPAPATAPPAGLHDRRAQPALAPVSAIEPAGGGREPRIPVSPQMALRVAIIGGVAMVMFGVIFFRLWYLQILSGEQYVQQANANRVRDLPIPAPRGQIIDRDGQTLVSSRVTNAVQIVPSALPPEGQPRLALYAKLGRLLGMSSAHVQALVIRGRTQLPYAPITIKTEAGPGVLTVLGERAQEFPGVVQKPVSIRDYPFGEMAAQVLGYVGSVSTEELKLKPFHGVPSGTVVGQEGLEYYYDRYLRGTPGVERVEVNANGYPVPSRLAPTQPRAGQALQVTLDLGLQKESEKALLQGISDARAGGKPAVAGAFVAMDPRNGEILAIGSYPSLQPQPLRQTDDPARIRNARGHRLGLRAAHRPGRQRHLSDRIDVQADHRHGGARRRRDHTRRRTRGGSSASTSRPSRSATPAMPTTAPSAWWRR